MNEPPVSLEHLRDIGSIDRALRVWAEQHDGEEELDALREMVETLNRHLTVKLSPVEGEYQVPIGDKGNYVMVRAQSYTDAMRIIQDALRTDSRVVELS